MTDGRHGRIRRAVTGAVSGCALILLSASCSDHPVTLDTTDPLTGVWSDYAGRTVEFRADGTFVGSGLDEAEVGADCPGIAGRQRGTVTLDGLYDAAVAFEGVDCEGMRLTFHGSPSSFVLCFTQDTTAGGCTDEFSRREGRPERSRAAAHRA